MQNKDSKVKLNLEKEYEDYAKFCKKDDKGFWQDWETASIKDINKTKNNDIIDFDN